MKITAFDPVYGTLRSIGGTTLVTSDGSNSGYGGDVVGTSGNLSVVGLRSKVSLTSNLTGSVGDALTLISSSPLVAQFATPSNSGASFGSNSTRVSETASAGAATTASRADHIHDGIGTVTASSSNTMQRGTLNLRPGSNISFGLTDTDGSGAFDTITINGAAGGGGGTVSAGSNSTRVSEISTAGASTTLWSPFDHAHDGIGTITSSSSNTMQRGTWNIRPGAGIALSLTDTDGDGEFDTTTIVNTGQGGGGGGVGNVVAGTGTVTRDFLANFYGETKPGSPNATYDDEFDDTTGMSGSVNGLAAKWNWRNQSTATATFGTAGWVKLAIPASASAAFRILEIAALADGTYDMKMSLQNGQAGDVGGGMVVIDGTNGDFYFWGFIWTAGAKNLYLQRWSSVTAWAANIANMGHPSTGIWLRLVKSGSNLTFWWSSDGIAWARIVATQSDAVTATRIGFGAYETSNSGDSALFVDFFRKSA